MSQRIVHIARNVAKRCYARSAVLCALLLLTALPARATEILWFPQFDADWNDPVNWFGYSVPGPTDTALFNGEALVTPLPTITQNTTVGQVKVLEFPIQNNGVYEFGQLNSSTLTVTGDFKVTSRSTNTTTPSKVEIKLPLNTGTLTLDGLADVTLKNNSQVTTTGALTMSEFLAGSQMNTPVRPVLTVPAGSSLLLAANTIHHINSGTLNVNSGTFSAGAFSTLDVFGPNSRINFQVPYNFTDNVNVTVQGGADLVAADGIHVGNPGMGSLLVGGAGSTLNAQGVSSWGRGAGNRADVAIYDGAEVNVGALNFGNLDGRAQLDVIGGTLTVNDMFLAGSGEDVRPVVMNLNNLGGTPGAINFEGTSLFHGKADLNVMNGTIAFTHDAIFLPGSRFDRSGGTMVIRPSGLLNIEGGVYEDTIAGGQILTDQGDIRVADSTGRFNVANFFDIGTGTLLVETGGQYNSPLTAVVTDWAQAAGKVATVNVRNGGLVNMGDLRVGQAGAATVDVRLLGELNTRDLTAGGTATSSAAFTVVDGLLNVQGNASLRQGTTVDVRTSAGSSTFRVSGNLELTGNATINATAPGGLGPAIRVTGALTTTASNVVELRNSSVFRVDGAATLNGGTIRLFDAAQFNKTSTSDLVLNNGARIDVNTGTSSTASSSRIVMGNVDAGAATNLNIAGGVVASLGGTIGLNLDTSAIASVSGATGRWNMGSGDLRIGVRGNGVLQLSGGGQVTNRDGFMGTQIEDRGDATATIDGNGSLWTNTRNLTVGATGTSPFLQTPSLTLSNGGSLAVGDAAGAIGNAITIADNDTIAANNGGLLTIANGGTVTTPGLVFLSRSTAQSGRLIVTGANSTLTANTVFVGERGRGDVRVEAGGRINATDQFQVSSELDSQGSATITGAGSTLNANFMTVGLFSGGSLDIADGGKVTAIAATLGRFPNSFGAINLHDAASRIEVTNVLEVGNQGGGALNVFDGARVVAPSVVINNQSGVGLATDAIVQGHVDNHGSFTARDSTVTGAVTLRSASNMFFDNMTIGTLTQETGGRLRPALRGVSDFDNLVVVGAASLAGEIRVSLGSGFAPTLGAQFPILTAGSLTGAPTFDFSAATLASGLVWNVLQSPTSIILQVGSPGIPGDFNSSGEVDGADFLLWQRGGSPSPLSQADLAQWRSNYGASASAIPSTSAVPEPQTLLLAALACLVLRRHCR